MSKFQGVRDFAEATNADLGGLKYAISSNAAGPWHGVDLDALHFRVVTDPRVMLWLIWTCPVPRPVLHITTSFGNQVVTKSLLANLM